MDFLCVAVGPSGCSNGQTGPFECRSGDSASVAVGLWV